MIRIGNAPCSWGVIENVPGERAGYARVLDEMRETGYAGTELGDWGFMPTDPAALRRELTARDLALLASWVDVKFERRDAHAEAEERALGLARLLAEVGGEKTMVVFGNDHSSVPTRARNAGRIGPQHGLDEDGWQAFAEGVNRIARAVREQTGLRSVMHHHCATWIETPEETEKLLNLTDPETVGLCFDTGHYRFGGGAPVAGLEKHGDRIWHVHFKDCESDVAARSRTDGWDYNTSVGHGVFCELGHGEVDFPAILAQLQAMCYDGWIVVEQDVLPGMGNPKESARRNRQYLRSIGL